MNEVNIPDGHPLLYLSEYWISAEHMRRLTFAIKPKSPEEAKRDWHKFRTYHSYWLSALYVVVEGFIELELDKTKVQEITDERINTLKLFRNGCFHYQTDHKKQLKFLADDPNLDWAGRLHEQFRLYLVETLNAPPDWGLLPAVVR
jgi:hypothetical protein